MIRARGRWLPVLAAAAFVVPALLASVRPAAARQEPLEADAVRLQQTLDRYCVACHNDRLRTAGLTLAGRDLSQVGAHAEIWEKVVTKLRTRTMPPVGRPRPAAVTYDALAGWLESEIDGYAAVHPHPGRTEAFHRLNRAEYANRHPGPAGARRRRGGAPAGG